MLVVLASLDPKREIGQVAQLYGGDHAGLRSPYSAVREFLSLFFLLQMILILYARLLHSLKLACWTTTAYFHINKRRWEGCQDSLGRPELMLEYGVMSNCMQDCE